MNINQLFFGTKILNSTNDIFTNSTAGGNTLFAKINFKIVASLFFLTITNIGFAQLATETFNSGIPTSWAVTSNIPVANNWIPSPTGGLQSTGAATVNPALNNTVGSTAEYFLITPQTTVPTNGEFRFYTKQGSFSNRGTIYQLRVSTANQPDISSFNVVLQTWTEAQLNTSATTYEQKIVPVPTIAGLNVFFALVAVTNQTGVTSTSGDTWFVDNARVITACPEVTGITSLPGSSSAVINWTHPTATNFSVQVVPASAGIGTSGTPVVGTTYTATGLTANTPYDFYIRTDCDPDTSSNWAGPFRFVTNIVGISCTAPIIIPSNVTTSPYILNSNLNQFYSPIHPDLTTVGSNCFPPEQFPTNQLLGNRIFFNYTPTVTGLIDITQAVSVISGGGPDACFNASSSVMVYNSCADVGGNCLAAITTGSNNATSQISNFYVVAGQTYLIVMSSPYQNTNPGASLCFTFTVSGSSCPAPATTGTTYNNLTQTSATFSWGNVGNLVSAWQYVVLPVSLGLPNAGTVGTPTTTNLNNPVSNLTPNTNYNLFVRSVCGGVPGSWSAAVPFKTPCNTFTVPYYTGFTPSDPTVECWSQLNLNNDLQFFNFANSAFSEPVARCRTINSNDILVSPQFNLDGVSQKRLRFKYNNYGNWGLIVNNPVGGIVSFEIRLSTTGVGPNNFTTVVVPITQYVTAYNFVELSVPLPNVVGNINIAWVLPAGAVQEGTILYIDDVYIEDLPPCSEPSYPIVTPGSITSTSATISWTIGYNNTQWQLVAQPLGSGTPTSTPVPGAITFNNVTTNPFTLTGLNPSTRYEFYMRAICSPVLQSIWTGPINFNTLCIAQPTPYYESLNDADVNTKKFCWSVINNSDELSRWRIEGTEAQIRAASTMFQPFVSFDDWLVSAPVNAVGLKRLRFGYRAVNGVFNPTPRGNVEVLLSSTPDFTTYTTLIPSFDFTNLAYEEASVLFTGTGTIYIAFRVPPTMTNPGNSGIMMIDDVYIEDAPPCPNPTNLTVANVTTSTASLSWVAGFIETQWQVAVQPNGTGVPTGSGTTANTSSNFLVTGLSADTQYEYYVRAVCVGNGNSAWVGPIRFKTDCIALPTPFLETFDSTSATESCWKTVDGNIDGDEWNLNQPALPMFGDQMAGLFTGGNGNNNDYLISPTLVAGPNQRLRYFYRTLTAFFEEDLKVLLSTNGSATNQFTTVLYENSLNTFTNATGVVTGSNTVTLGSAQDVRVGDFIYIPGFPFPYPTYVAAVQGTLITLTNSATITQTGVQNIQFSHELINNPTTREKVINLTGITVPTNINIAFQTPFFPPNPWGYRGQYTFIDNVIIEDIPACPSVINVVSSNLIDTAITLNWEEVGTATTWEISLQPAGTPAPIGNTLPQYLTTTTTRPKTITGLIPSTQYQYYVRAICSGTSQSVWVGPFTFTTKCDFSNVCQYRITVTNGNTGQVQDNVQVKQNGVVLQNLEFPSTGSNQPTSIDYDVFLCRGVEFSLYWNALGSGVQYSQAQIVIRDESNNIVWTSPLGLGTPYTNIYTAVATCGVVTCAQPTNVTINNLGTFSWNPVPGVSQYEVFIQPVTNGTIPQSGTIVNSTTYTPIASDFINPAQGTYEFFVRAICSATSKSFWTGPKVFIRNDEASTSVSLPVNPGTECGNTGIMASFIGATVSTNPTICTGNNSGDIWYDFIATSKVHIIEIGNLAPGSYYTSSFQGAWPKIIMALYEVQPNGSLLQKGCSENNSMVTMYTSELVVGKTYKIRFSLNDPVVTDKNFSICITTPVACDMNAFNYDFEKLPMQNVTGVTTIINARVTPGWRVNTDWGTMFFQEASNSLNVTPYSGGQCIQLTQDGTDTWIPNDPNIKGLYKDFDTSEIPKMDYSFASATRSNTTTVNLYAGPPSGPFTLVAQHTATSLVWQLIQGTYNVPSGQTTTRFIFRVEGNNLGHLLDAANFKPNTNINIATANTTLDCTTTSMNFDANGVGMWEAEPTNPSVTTIASPNTGATAVTGFNVPGSYIFRWKTRYCTKSITITKQGNAEIPVVVTPTIYCLNAIASPLTATVAPGNTLKWYTQAVGGTGTTIAPTPSTAVVGSSQVYYVTSTDNTGCESIRTQIVVQINDLPTATISGTTTICSGTTTVITFTGTPNAIVTYTVNGGSNQTITLDATGTATSTTPSLTANASYNLVSVTTVGANPCSQAQVGSALVTVNDLPTATISGATTICSGATAVITFTGTPNAIVTYTINGGSNQTITLSSTGTASITSPVLTANSTYTLVSVASGTTTCSQPQTGSVLVTVTPLTIPNVAFSYAQTCINATVNPLPVLTPNFVTGGVFSSTTVTVNPTTGAVNLASATVASHVITYTLAANATICLAETVSTATLVISSGVTPVTSFSYGANYCSNSSNALPATASGFTTGGTYTATPSGLLINSTTGEITISGSSLGTYTIVYSVAANAATCTIAGSSNSTLTISAIPVVIIDDVCQNQQLVLEALPVNNSFNPNSVTYSWSVSNTPILGSNESTFNVDEYLEQNPSLSLPLQISVSVSLNGCEGFSGFEVLSNPCKIIPRGISPNDDGDNDTFDLTGFGVRELIIFNRYGASVYTYNGTYTNQWEGQSDQGDELPDGTYFYSVNTIDGVTKTGWVYINRQY